MEKVKYNLDKLLKVTLYLKDKPKFEYYQKEKRGWFNILLKKEGFYTVFSFGGDRRIEQPKNTYLENDILYYEPHVTYKFIDGTIVHQWCKTEQQAKLVYELYKELTELPIFN
jgi:hypothetical protein